MRHNASVPWPPSAHTQVGASQACATAYDAPRHPPHQSNSVYPRPSLPLSLYAAHTSPPLHQRTAYRMHTVAQVVSSPNPPTHLTSLRVPQNPSSLIAFRPRFRSSITLSVFPVYRISWPPLYPAKRFSALVEELSQFRLYNHAPSIVVSRFGGTESTLDMHILTYPSTLRVLPTLLPIVNVCLYY